jgi:Arc/MetJ family transcription regulator
MQVVEIDESLAAWAGKAAKEEDKTLQDFVNSAVRELLRKRNAERPDEEKIRRFAESYSTFPQKADEWEIWQDEQVWENE